VPLEGGLLSPIATLIGARAIDMCFGDANAGLDGVACCFFVVFSLMSALKLPRTLATLPPKTRPSGPASETLSLLVQVGWPPISCTKNDPYSDNISNRPRGGK
jgi:hypothetical protein